MTETRDPEDHRSIAATFGLTWTPGRDKDGQPPNDADMFAGERAAWGPDWDKPAVRTDALLARLEAELEDGAIVMYRPATRWLDPGFAFRDTADEHGEVFMSNALSVPKAAITPAVEHYLASHRTWTGFVGGVLWWFIHAAP